MFKFCSNFQTLIEYFLFIHEFPLKQEHSSELDAAASQVDSALIIYSYYIKKIAASFIITNFSTLPYSVILCWMLNTL